MPSTQISAPTAQIIDEEIRAIIDRNYERARNILEENIEKLHLMADALMKYETIDVDQINAIMEGREPGPPSDWTDDNGPSGRPGGPDTVKPVPEDDKSDGKIGGPAGQH